MSDQPINAHKPYDGCTEVVPGVFIDIGDALYIVDAAGEVVTWNWNEVAEDGEAYTAALFAVALAAKRGPSIVRANLANGGASLVSLIEETAKPTTLLCCPRCKSSRIQHQMWVRANTNEVLDETGRYGWCDACEEDGNDGELHNGYCDELPADQTREALEAASQSATTN